MEYQAPQRLNENGRLTDEYVNFMEKMPENMEKIRQTTSITH